MSKKIYENVASLERGVRKAVAEATITDIHTHLFPPSHGDLLSWGLDELLTYHYLVAELFSVAPTTLTCRKFFNLPKAAQADLVWKYLFVESSPISESRRGVLTVLSGFGLDPADRDLARLRKHYPQQPAEEHLEKAFQLAGVDYAVMTNDMFNREQVEHFRVNKPVGRRLKPAMRIDPLVLDFPGARPELARQGCQVHRRLGPQTSADLNLWLGDWADRIDPAYMAVSLPAGWHYPADDDTTRLLEEVICPLSAERNLPVAMMLGVRRGVNPDLGSAGDAVGQSDIPSVIRLCRSQPTTKFLVTSLSRVDQHELTVVGRKFRNLHLFGCWWFCNNPSITEEMTRQRLELLGTDVTLQHSDAYFPEQLIYKWGHTRRVVADVLVDKYIDAHNAGWRFTEADLTRDARRLLGGAFEEFLAR